MAKKKQEEKVRCMDCKHAELMQWGSNPVISKCEYKLYRQVANALRTCVSYAKGGNKVIKRMRYE